jgi:uncharacterized protein YbjT (DUF2867 family)
VTVVFGATGQLGTAIVRALLEQGQPVRAFVRRHSAYGHLEAAGAELAFGDLRDAASIEAACRGGPVVISTATGISPVAGGGDVKAVDDEGHRKLIEACKRSGVEQLIFASFPPGALDRRVALSRAKRDTETRLMASGVPYTIFQLGMFADIWPALLGSRIPERGADVRTLDRPFWFLRAFRKATGDLIDKRGMASAPGRPDTRVSFIAIDDVARIMANAVDHPQAINQVLQLGGPEVLTWAETIELFSRVLDRPIRPIYAPGGAFRALQLAMSPISRSGASILGLNYLAARGELPPPDPDESKAIALRFGVVLMPFEEFLQAKAQLQPA